MSKDFDSWNELKKGINDKKRFLHPKKREIWWCHLGLNIGYEQDGKNKRFLRPVLILKVYNFDLFLAVPLTTRQNIDNPYYVRLNDNLNTCIISQIKVLSSNRLSHKLSKVTGLLQNL